MAKYYQTIFDQTVRSAWFEEDLHNYRKANSLWNEAEAIAWEAMSHGVPVEGFDYLV